MVKWADICTPKELGGLGITASRHMNVALMLKWVWRILRDEGGLWLQLIKAKYLQGCPLLACERKEGSQFWRSIQAIKHEIRRGIIWSIGDGTDILFWLDPWLGSRPLRSKFPALFAICSDPMLLVADASPLGTWDFQFRRNFGPVETAQWEELRASIPMALRSEERRVGKECLL